MAEWGQGLKGGAGGAMAGFSLGGPIGGLIGGGLGFLGGAFGGGESDQDAQMRRMLQDYYAQAGGRPAPQAGQAAQGGLSSFRGNQQDLVGRLEALSRGQGPSLAAQQFQAATDRNMAAQQSLAQTGRGGPLAAFNAANNMGQLGAQAAQGSAMARVAEQQMALNQLGLTLHGARGSDEEMSRFNAGAQNQTALANLDAQLRSRGMDDQTRLQILSQLGGQNTRQAMTPGLGDQILAGGAGISSFLSSQRAANNSQGGYGSLSPIAAGNPGSGGYWTPQPQTRMMGGSDPFGQYRRNPDGSLGPVTSTQGF
jgi:hypothetical protein